MDNVPLFIVVVRHKVLYEITFISLNFIHMIYRDNWGCHCLFHSETCYARRLNLHSSPSHVLQILQRGFIYVLVLKLPHVSLICGDRYDEGHSIIPAINLKTVEIHYWEPLAERHSPNCWPWQIWSSCNRRRSPPHPGWRATSHSRCPGILGHHLCHAVILG